MGVCNSAESARNQPELSIVEQESALLKFNFKLLDCKRDGPDSRDWVLNAAEHSKVKGIKLPESVDLRPEEAFAIYNQGELGSCTANALAESFHFEQWRQGVIGFSPSRLFIYYNERAMEGHISEDAGASLRDGIQALKNIGVCSESLWPYKPELFKKKPSAECYLAAKENTCQQYARVEQSLESLKFCLAAGFPFVFGFQVFCDFMIGETAQTGNMAWPPHGLPHGGHAVQACGYDDAKQAFIVRNSWGPEWGDKGYFYVPYKFMVHSQLCHDFWAILHVSSGMEVEFPVTKPVDKAGPSTRPTEDNTATQASLGGA